MTDHAQGPVPELPEPVPDRRAYLRSWGLALWPVLRAHPWLTRTAVGVRVMGPNEFAWTEAALAAFTGTALGGAERLDAVALIAGHVRGIAQQTPPSGPGPEGGEGVEEGMVRAMAPVLAEHGGRYPETLAAFSDTRGRDSALEFGLDCILDGLERRFS